MRVRNVNQRNMVLSEELDNTLQLLEEEKQRPLGEACRIRGDVSKLKADLKAAKDKAKQMWTLSCSQSREQEEQIAALEAEVACLKTTRPREASIADSPSLPVSHQQVRIQNQSQAALPVEVKHLPLIRLLEKTRPLSSTTGYLC